MKFYNELNDFFPDVDVAVTIPVTWLTLG